MAHARGGPDPRAGGDRGGDDVRIAYLADHPGALATIAAALHAESREYYGDRTPADVAGDLRPTMQRDALPLALVALRDGAVVGTAALREDSITTHPHLHPWLAALHVLPEHRGRGVGLRLIEAVEEEARRLGFARIHAGSGRAAALFERRGWRVLERTPYHGETISILARDL